MTTCLWSCCFLLHSVHATSCSTSKALLSRWTWHLLAWSSSSHCPPLVRWHEAISSASMHWCSLPGSEASHCEKGGPLPLWHSRHKVWWVHLHLVLHRNNTYIKTCKMPTTCLPLKSSSNNNVPRWYVKFWGSQVRSRGFK